MEREPVRLPRARAASRCSTRRARRWRAFVGADPDDLAFVPNATARRQRRAALARARSRATSCSPPTTPTAPAATRSTTSPRARGARVVVARGAVPARRATTTSSSACSRRSRRARGWRCSTTSPARPALVFPIARLVRGARARAASTRWSTARTRRACCRSTLDALGAAYYTGNAHKWLCAPKGAAFLHVRRDRQARRAPARDQPRLRPARRTTRASASSSTGPAPPTRRRGWRCPNASASSGGLLPGGWPELMARNRALALRARAIAVRGAGRRRAVPRRHDRLAWRRVPLPRGRARLARGRARPRRARGLVPRARRRDLALSLAGRGRQADRASRRSSTTTRSQYRAAGRRCCARRSVAR